MLTVHRCKPFGQAVAKLRKVKRHDRPGARAHVREPGEPYFRSSKREGDRGSVCGKSSRPTHRPARKAAVITVPVTLWCAWCQSAYMHARVHVHVLIRPRAIAAKSLDSRV